ncbi:MAG: ubiquinol-cytochrome c reductase iron-sulfur subunit [Wenzhouxiangella sp.]|nr:ubiquinol-cytochrome c reductase iron-sulfur subunit [Wenzhouxiangella sp.]MCH8476690.1 ubiquinol-cytochrome c reductase iron-sulfur subunit [Wenzhouxiangella sp.]TVR96003.1 MAG: ubiquinol-cytochrome c reductase iron-sulfur subunit [Wenzhouxiangellaceae bacterium]
MSETEALDSEQPSADLSRRRLLLGTTGVVGAVGVAAAAWPFLASLRPSARARIIGAPVEVFIGNLEPGQMARVQWRGQTIGIMRRTERMLAQLPDLNPRLRDPESAVADQQPAYARNVHRSIRPEILVLNVHCTHLGCVPQVIPEVGPQPFDADWRGGFFCPCHRSTFDLAGRVFSGVPAVRNLLVPPHSFIDDDHVIIGVDYEGAS